MKMRNFEERSAMVADFQSSGQSQEAYAKTQGVKVSSLRRWLGEARKAQRDTASGSGFVEVNAVSFSGFGQAACRVVVGELSFEFGALPGPSWLAEFSQIFSSKVKRQK